jgi:hypothetical protein
MRRTRIPFLLVLLAISGPSACKLDKDLAGPDLVTGDGLVYNLVDVNAKPTPAVLAPGPPKVEILRGALTLSADSTWIVSLIFRLTGPGSTQVETSTTRGSYTRANTALTLKLASTSATQYSGTWSSTDVQLTDMASTTLDRLGFRIR